VGVKDGRILFGEIGGNPFFHVQGLDLRLFDSYQKPFAFLLAGKDLGMHRAGLHAALVDDEQFSQAESGRSCGACQRKRLMLPFFLLFQGLPVCVEEPLLLCPGQLAFEIGTLFFLAPDRVEQFCIDDDAGDLVGNGGQGTDLMGGEDPCLPGLDDNDADRSFSLEERQAEKGGEFFFTGFPEVFKARMSRSVLYVHHAPLFDDEAGEPL